MYLIVLSNLHGKFPACTIRLAQSQFTTSCFWPGIYEFVQVKL